MRRSMPECGRLVLYGEMTGSPLRVNLRRDHFVRTGPLNPNLPPLQMHPQAAAVRLRVHWISHYRRPSPPSLDRPHEEKRRIPQTIQRLDHGFKFWNDAAQYEMSALQQR